MADIKVNIYSPSGKRVGYFLNPAVEAFPEGDYEISGSFFDERGAQVTRLEFNPEALPYTADLSEVPGSQHEKLSRVYVQRGRPPFKMSASANN